MTYFILLKKQIFNLLLISVITTVTYFIVNIWGMGNPLVQSKTFFWFIAGVVLTYLFILPLLALLQAKHID